MTPDHLLKEYKNATNIEIDDTEDLIKRMSKKSIKEKRSQRINENKYKQELF